MKVRYYRPDLIRSIQFGVNRKRVPEFVWDMVGWMIAVGIFMWLAS